MTATMEELVEALRLEIGLAPDDTTQDEWLTARANAALAAMRRYCRRWLWPASQFRDAFLNDERYLCFRCGGQVAVLAEIPVVEIISVVSDGAPQPAAEFQAASTGRLLRKQGTNLVPVVSFAQLLVDYVGGYVDLPPDIYEAIAGVVKRAWASTEAGSAEAIGRADKLTVFDVGSVEFSGGGGAFYEGEAKVPTGVSWNPILGPWTGLLESYRDYSRGIGLPVSRESSYIGAAP